ncbi:MAG TPA: SOS response-associated peptidase [Burkholderiales bacterium]|nr:SOS response-associated peptidase [Burkholderiales bacterium]
MPILRAGPAGFELSEARWGLIPFWWTQPKPPQSILNARAEEAAGKPTWRQPYRHSRCLLPAAGWYEWQALDSMDAATGEVRRAEQPFFIHAADRRLACFAGLLSVRRIEGAEHLSCAILTRAAAGRAAEVHERMPVVLREAAFGNWLAPEMTNPEEVASLLGIARADFEYYRVSIRLNAARTDDAELQPPQ